MKNIFLVCFFYASFLSANLKAQTNILLLSSFESSTDLSVISTNGTTIALSTNGATLGQYSCCINFSTKSYPGIIFSNGIAFTNRDWRSFAGLAFDVLNTNASPIQYVYAKVYDDSNSESAPVIFPANVSGAVVATFPQAAVTGMKAGPPLAYTNVVSAPAQGSALDWSKIKSFQIFISTPSKAKSLFIDNLRLVGLPPTNGWVDAYGQYTGYDWPGKIHQQSDFTNQMNQEQQWFASHPKPNDRDTYGAWQAGPILTNNGFFRTAWLIGTNETAYSSTNTGRWWLVAPSGRLFYSLGIDMIDYGENTLVSGRTNLFTWLPGAGDPLQQFALPGASQSANFYGMNLYREYGANWMSLSRAHTCDRLINWGINTIGNWSSSDYFSDHRVAYTVPPWYDWSGVATFNTSSSGATMVDPFDPNFVSSVDAGMSSGTAAWKNDPWCLGYFVDNELPWGSGAGSGTSTYSLPVAVLAYSGSLPAKGEFAREMQVKYATIAGLNTAWNVSLASWSAFSNQTVTLPATWTNNANCVADLSGFLSNFATRYFSVIDSKLKLYAPHQLYLGCRFASHPNEVVQAAAQYCDVISFNAYVSTLTTNNWPFTSMLDTLGKPCMIGEFHFGALDRGMFSPGLVAAINQAGRGQDYQGYLRSIMSLPSMVGCHWFQYYDEPVVGRSDGENYNCGFVSQADTPYWELIEAVQQISSQVYSTFSTPAKISVANSSTNLLLSWPFLPDQAVLESAPTLSNASAWLSVTSSISYVGAQKVISVSTTQSSGFFRLRQP